VLGGSLMPQRGDPDARTREKKEAKGGEEKTRTRKGTCRQKGEGLTRKGPRGKTMLSERILKNTKGDFREGIWRF